MTQPTNPILGPTEDQTNDLNKVHEGDTMTVGIAGIPGPVGPPGPPGIVVVEKTRTFKVLLGIAAVLFVFSLLSSQLFAWGEVSSLRDRLNTYLAINRNARAQSDCLALYRNDVSVALGSAVAANNALWVQVATRPFAATDEERAVQAEDNARLGAELDASNKPLILAVTALHNYDRIDPPPGECPHPEAVRQRQILRQQAGNG